MIRLKLMTDHMLSNDLAVKAFDESRDFVNLSNRDVAPTAPQTAAV
jgi:hypothetical protein